MRKGYRHQVSEFSFRKESLPILFIIILSFYSIKTSYAQIYTFSEIKEIFFRERPQTGDPTIRKNALGSIDDLIFGPYPPLHPDMGWFFEGVLVKAMLEIRNEDVAEGASIWQIYNHGFVVRTPSVSFGIDLYDFFKTTKFLELADLIDVYFISHAHGDHFSRDLIFKMRSLNKPVVGPGEVQYVTTVMHAGESDVISNCTVNAHDGLHSVPVRQFEIITPEGFKFLHTGDNQTSETLPLVTDVDVLLLNGWINESGATSNVVGIRKAIDKVKPKVTLPGHILELGHLGSLHPPISYQSVIDADDGSLASEYCILGLGERYHYSNSSNDSIRPHIVQNLSAEVRNDSVLVSWDMPQIAEDGDTATFFRIFKDDVDEFFVDEQCFGCQMDTIRNYHFKVYAYDDCGNQSENVAELDYTPPSDVNYPPRITNSYPQFDDTVAVFAGVHKLFSVSAIDINDDAIYYSWTLDQNRDLGTSTATCPFNVAGLDSGFHDLTVTVTDQEDATEKSWLIVYHTNYAIVDNEDSLMYSEQGDWEPTTISRAYGPDCRYTLLSNVGDWALFKFYPEKPGNYDVFEMIPEARHASENALYTIIIDGQNVDSVYINQNEGSGDWVKIGRFYFPAGVEVGVRVTHAGSTTEGSILVSDAVKFNTVGDVLHIEKIEEFTPVQYVLFQNYPNPFNLETKISFSLPQTSQVSIKIYDLLGKVVGTLVNERLNEGVHSFIWQAENMSSGIYYYTMKAGVINRTMKMLLTR